MPDALGVAHAHYEHKPAQIGRYFRSCLAQSDEGQLKLLGWPSNCRLLASRDAKIAARHLRLRPWLCAKLREVAAAYIRPEGLDIGRLGDSPEGYEARASVFVVLMHESRWKDGRELDPEMVIKAYNMIKHGLNATAVFHSYDDAALVGATAIVLEIPKDNALVQRLGREISLAGVLCRELARMTIELDDLKLLETGGTDGTDLGR